MSLGRFNIPNPAKYDYIVDTYTYDRSSNMGGHVKKSDIMMLNGPDAIDTTDLTAMAIQYARDKFGDESLSQNLNPFYNQIRNAGGIKEIDHDKVTWKSFGKPHKDLRSMGNPNDSKLKCLGLRDAPFKVRFNNGHLENLTLAYVMDPSCQIKIISKGRSKGGVWEYDAINFNKNSTISPQVLRMSAYWHRLAPLTGTDSSGDAGTFEVSTGFSYIRFKVHIGVYKWKYSISEGAYLADKTIKIQKCGAGMNKPLPGYEKGKLISYMNLKMDNQIKADIENQIAMGRFSKNHHTDSITRHAEQSSPGIQQWMEQGKNVPYTPTIDGFSMIMADAKSRWNDHTPVNMRHWNFYGGEAACELFQAWVEREYGKTVRITIEDSLLKESHSFEPGRDGKALSPYQYTKYHFPMFGSVSMHHWSFLDNQKMYGKKMPGTQHAINSYEIWAFPKSAGSNDFNTGFQLVSNKHKNRMTIYPGTIAPNGYVNENNPIWTSPSLDEYEGYKKTYKKSIGLVHFAPHCMLRYYPDIVQY